MHNMYSDTSINNYRKWGVLSVKSCYMILGNCSLVSNAEGREETHLILNVINKRTPIDSFLNMESNILAVKYSM